MAPSALMSLVDAEAAEGVQMPLVLLYVELGMHTNTSAVTDKNGQRYCIMQVLRALWQQPRVWAALQKVAVASASDGTGADAEAFGSFAETLVKEEVFLLNDALGRLADVHTRQEEMGDEEKWKQQSASVRREREARLESVKRTARGFLDLSKASQCMLSVPSMARV